MSAQISILLFFSFKGSYFNLCSIEDDDSEKENNNTNKSPSSSTTPSPAPSMPSSPTSSKKKPAYSLDYCEAIAAKISNVNEHMPQECRKYQSVREALIRRRDSDHAVAFKGMHSGQAVSAMAARERGHLNPCQIQRKFTNRKASDRRVW